MITQTTQLTREMVEHAEMNGTLDELHGQEVNRLVRLRYSSSQEYAIHRKKLRGTGDEKFAKYDAYIEECKVVAWENINRFRSAG